MSGLECHGGCGGIVTVMEAGRGVVFRKVCVVGTKPGQSGGQFKWRPQSQPQRVFALF